MMNQVVEGIIMEQPRARENVNYIRVMEQCQFEALQQQQAVVAYVQQKASSSMGSGIRLNNFMGAPQLSLKEVIETNAREHDIQFFPKVGCTHDGLQVYGYGTISIYLDSIKQQVLVQSGDRLVIVSLEHLVEMHCNPMRESVWKYTRRRRTGFRKRLHGRKKNQTTQRILWEHWIESKKVLWQVL